MKKIGGCFLLITIVCLIIVLSKTKLQSVQSVQSDLYNGRPLNIGIIGEIPKVREKDVKFVKIHFSDLEKKTFNSQYDAIFITKDNLSEAAHRKYVSIYKTSKIPLFFIQNEKSYVPFIEEDLSYEETNNSCSQSYATGIICHDDNLKYWEYCLYNDIENEANIQDVYSRIFNTISQNTTPK